jgi:hypothetical protein
MKPLTDTEVKSLREDDFVYLMERGEFVGPFRVLHPVGWGMVRSSEHIALLNGNNVFEAFAMYGNLYKES